MEGSKIEARIIRECHKSMKRRARQLSLLAHLDAQG